MLGRDSDLRRSTAVAWCLAALTLALGLSVTPAWAVPVGQPAAVPALTWSAPIALDHTGDTDIFAAVDDVSCPTATQCTAVDTNGQEVTFDPRNPGTPTPRTLLARSPLTGISCPSTHQCTATDNGSTVVTFDPTDALATRAVATLSGNTGFVSGAITCPSVHQCTDVGGPGTFEITFDPTAPGSPTLVNLASDGAHPLVSVSCPSRSLCAAGAHDGSVVTFDPAHPEAATLTPLDRAGINLSVSCPTQRRCTAVGSKGLNGGTAVTFDPMNPTSTVVSTLPGRGGREDVDCPTAYRCVAVTSAGQEVTFTPTNPAAGVVTVVTKPVLAAVACPAAAQCTAVGTTAGDYVQATFNPTRPGTPAVTTIAAPTAVHDLSCPTASQCTAVDDNGNAVTFDPAAPDAALAPTPVTPGDSLISVDCPTTSRCVAIQDLESTSSMQVTFDPRHPAVATPYSFRNVELLDIACPSAGTCVGVGYDGKEVTFDPTALGAAPSVGIGNRSSDLNDVVCPSSTSCVATDTIRGTEITFDPADPAGSATSHSLGDDFISGLSCPSTSQCTYLSGPNSATFDPADPSNPVTAPVGADSRLDCPTTTSCTAVGSNGQAVSFNPRSSAAAHPTYLPGARAFATVQCPTTKRCVAVDLVGNLFVGTAPGG